MEEKITSIKFDTTEAEKSVKQLRQEISGLRDVILNTEEGTEEYNSAVKQLITSQDELNKVSDKTIKGTTAAAGSYEALVFEMAQLKKEWRATGDEAKRDEIGKQISGLNGKLKDMDASIGSFQRNVGDYANQIEVASNSIAGMKQQLAELNTKLNSMDINSQEFKDTKNVIDKLSLAVDQASGKVDEFGNREPKNIAKKNFEDTMVTVTILSSSINALSSAFSDDEDVQKSLQKATQALAISQSIANVVKEKGAIIDTVTLVKEKALVASKWVLNTVTKVFGITSTQAWAAATLGVSLLIAGIIALVSNFQAIIGAVKEFFGVTNEFAETEKQINNLSKALDYYGEKTSRVTDRLKAEGKTEQEVVDFKKRRYEEELKLNQNRYNQLKSLTRDLTDKEKEMKAESAEFIRNQNIARYEFETEQIALNNKAKEKAADDERKRVENQNKINEVAAKRRKEQREKEAAEQKRLQEEAERRQAEYARKVVEIETWVYEQKLSGKEKEEYELQKAFDARVEQIGIEKAIELGLEEQFKIDLSNINKKYADEEQARIDAENQKKKEADQKAADESVKIEEKKIEEKKKLQQQNLDFSLAMAGALSSILNDIGEANSKDAKKKKNLQIASAYIDMLAGAVSAFTQAGNPILGAVIAASVVTAGLVNIKKMKETKIEGSSGGDSVATPSVNVANLMATQRPVQAVSTTTGASAEQQIQDTRVYVVESDIAATTKKVAVAQAEATY